MPSMSFKRIEDVARFEAEKMAKVPLFSTPRLLCDLYCLRPGHRQRVHAHRESDKIYLALRGEGVVQIGDESHPMRAGETVLARAGIEHGIANESDGDLVCFVVMSPPPGAHP
jgi:mannose-6-phosphate isomerase-like protein (cupin superfamily)